MEYKLVKSPTDKYNDNFISDCSSCSLFDICSKCQKLSNDVIIGMIDLCKQKYKENPNIPYNYRLINNIPKLMLYTRKKNDKRLCPECNDCIYFDTCNELDDRDDLFDSIEYKLIINCKRGYHYETVQTDTIIRATIRR